MITELERNKTVWKYLLGDVEPNEWVLENRFVDWDKAWTCIFYNKKSVEMEERGEAVYTNIRQSCSEFLEMFKKRLEELNKQ